MSDDQLHRYGRTIEDRERRVMRWAVTLARRPIAYAFLAVFLFGSGWLLAHPPYEWAYATVWGVTAVALAIYAWGIYWYAQRVWFEWPFEVPGGETGTIRSERGVYVPDPDRIAEIRRAVEKAYEDAGLVDSHEWPRVWTGPTGSVQIDVLQDPPSPRQRPLPSDHPQRKPEGEEPRELVQGNTVIGLAYPAARTVELYGPYAEDFGLVAYEMSHLVDQYLWPGQSEKKDLEKGKELGVRPIQEE